MQEGKSVPFSSSSVAIAAINFSRRDLLTEAIANPIFTVPTSTPPDLTFVGCWETAERLPTISQLTGSGPLLQANHPYISVPLL
jgi:hypothetical protein